MKSYRCHLHRILGAVLAFLVTCLTPGALLAPTQAAGLHIITFYTTTETKGGNAAPTRITTFSAGTVHVVYYFQYTDATPKVTQFQAVIHNPDGTSVKGAVHTLHYVAGSYSNDFYNQPAFPPGAYTLDLLVRDKQVSTTHFTVKPGVVVPDFFTTTKRDIDAWTQNANASSPRRTTTFPSGTTDVGYYFSFAGVTPKVTTFRVNIYDHSGAVVLEGDLHTLHHTAGYFGNSFYDHSAFPDGAYRMDLTLKGGVRRSTTFTIGG